MKFQNPSLIFFLNGRKDGRTNERTNERTSRNQYAPHFFKVGGIIKQTTDDGKCLYYFISELKPSGLAKNHF